MGDSTLLDAALASAAQGKPVFPCKNTPENQETHKAPLTRNGFKDATNHPAQVRRWWTDHPDALIGMPTGATTGLGVLDLDVKKGKNGLQHVPDWESLSPCIARTGSGGIHVYFRSDGTIRNSTEKIAPGVDTRGEGGYVIVPPSPGYEWIGTADLSQLLPLWPDHLRPTPREFEPKPGAEPQANSDKVAAALDVIPNDDVGWDDWKRVGMAAWAATGGDEHGYEAFRKWSEKSGKYDRRKTEAAWDQISHSPPDRIGAGTLFHLARETEPAWEATWWVKQEAAIKLVLEAATSPERIREHLAWLRELEAKTQTSIYDEAAHAEAEPLSQSEPPPIEPESPSPSSGTKPKGPSLSLLKTSAQFVGEFVPPDYLIDGLLQRRFLYSLTAPTGFGKTCVALRIAAHVALGLPLNGREVMQGNVVYFAGENPDDVRMRFIKQCADLGREPDDVPVLFLATRERLSSATVRTLLRSDTYAHNPVSLVIVDTSAAFFEGKDENDNVDAVAHARMLRDLIGIVAGGPTILVTCHPTKAPDLTNLIPRGGGAFVNEVDGNLALTKESMTLEMTTHGKFRGPDFAPISFRLNPGTVPSLKDSRGRSIPTVTAEPITPAEREAMDERADANLDRVLAIMDKNPGISIRDIAVKLGWTYQTGEPAKSHVQRLLNLAAKTKLATKTGRKWALTKAGKEAAAAAGARPL